MAGYNFTIGGNILVGGVKCAGANANTTIVPINSTGAFSFGFQIPLPGVVNTDTYFCTAIDSAGRTGSSTIPYELNLDSIVSVSPQGFSSDALVSVSGTKFLASSTVTSIVISCPGAGSTTIGANILINPSGNFTIPGVTTTTTVPQQGSPCSLLITMFGTTKTYSYP